MFFLHNNDTNSESSDTSLENVNDINADQGEPQGALSFGHNSPVSAVAEVLDLTHNHNDPFMLHFDDKDWQKYLPNLKPLGLAILLNTCHVDTQVSVRRYLRSFGVKLCRNCRKNTQTFAPIYRVKLCTTKI